MNIEPRVYNKGNPAEFDTWVVDNGKYRHLVFRQDRNRAFELYWDGERVPLKEKENTMETFIA